MTPAPHLLHDFHAIRPFGGFDLVMADPPWHFGNWSERGEDKNAKAHYDCQPLDWIKAMPVQALAADNCLLWLQGFPDDFTRIPRAKGSWRRVDDAEDLDDLRACGMPLKLEGNDWFVKDPDGPRYKALGNSMAVNVMEWIGERIAEVESVA